MSGYIGLFSRRAQSQLDFVFVSPGFQPREMERNNPSATRFEKNAAGLASQRRFP